MAISKYFSAPSLKAHTRNDRDLKLLLYRNKNLSNSARLHRFLISQKIAIKTI